MPYTVILHFHTRVRSHFGCLFGQISTFFTFFGIKLALLSQSKASASPFVPRAGFLEPCSCFFKTFHHTFLASVSTSARNQEKHQKNAKMRFFSPSAIFFAEKHFVGCRYIYSRTSLTCTNDSPSNEVYFQNFRQPYSIRATHLAIGGASSRYFSTSRPDRNTRVGPLAPSVVALAVHQKPCL